MNVVTRGVRNAFRNTIRTFSIIVILGLSIGLAITMVIARQAVQSKIDSVKSSIGNTITVSPAGARGFQGGGTPLTNDNVTKINSTAHVVSTTATLQDRLSAATSNLVSAIDPGTIGRRFRGEAGGTQSGGATAAPDGAVPTFVLPVSVTGTSNATSTSSLGGGGTVKITSGTTFDGTKDANVAILGTALATKNNLKVGSTFTAYGATVNVVGIYDAGNDFSNSALIMPLPTVQRLSAQPGQVSSVTVQVDSISNLDATTASLKSSLGSAADVVSQQDTSATALAPLESIKNISFYSLVGAVAAGAAIILLTMLMIVRERRREIGVLKAIGASNVKVVAQFMTEAITFTMIAAVAGLIIGILAASPVTKILVTSTTDSTVQSGGFRAGGGPGGSVQVSGSSGATAVQVSGGGPRGFGRIAALSGNSIRNINTTIGWNLLLYGFAAALFIAIVGSAVPAWLIAKVRPAEVMRAE